ncbi:MAG: hypothetical protein P5700_25685, partial [Arthrospira platensis PCC 7345]|nr:hypothetical protein [Arthrospira platensis PCC 7345]
GLGVMFFLSIGVFHSLLGLQFDRLGRSVPSYGQEACLCCPVAVGAARKFSFGVVPNSVQQNSRSGEEGQRE